MTLPEIVGGRDERGAFGNTGAVYQYVDVAQTFTRFFEHPRHAFGIGDVANNSDCAIPDFSGDLLDLFRCSCGDGDPRAMTRESMRNRSTDSATAAGDEGDPVFENHFRHGLMSGKPRVAFFEERAHAFVAVVRFKTTQLRLGLVTKHLVEVRAAARVDRLLRRGDRDRRRGA